MNKVSSSPHLPASPDSDPAVTPSGDSAALSPLSAAADLPRTWTRYGLTSDLYLKLMQCSLPVVARVGSSLSAEQLQQLAACCTVFPDHWLLQDPAAFYDECLRFASSQLWPDFSQALPDDLSRTIPADAIRSLVSATFRRIQAHPQALRLVISENLFDSANLAKRNVLLPDSPVVLQLDRVLMRGHDVGAFRASISAEDLYILILSLCSFPVALGSTFHQLYGMNVTEPANVNGLETLAKDAVLAFLTTPMPASHSGSYTHSSLSMGLGPSVAANLYSGETATSPLLHPDSSSFSDAAPDYPENDPYQHE